MFNVAEIHNKMFFVMADTQHEIASLFMRIQEFYESPYENIRGKYFTMDEYMDTYADQTGAMTYTLDWNGFNIPGDVIKEFFSVFEFDLRAKERILLNSILALLGVDSIHNVSEKFYLIGTSKEAGESVMHHEIAHAFYYLSDAYHEKAEWSIILADKPTHRKIEKIKNRLRKMGYAENVIIDEVQAYLATSSNRYLIETFGLFNIPWKIVKNLREIYKKFEMR